VEEAAESVIRAANGRPGNLESGAFLRGAVLSRGILCRVLGAMKLRAFVFGAVTCLGCAAKPPPPVAPAAPAAVAKVAEAEDPPDLSPVAAPEELVLVGRLSRPRLLVETVAGWAGLPVRLRDLLPEELRGVDAVLAWDAPLEIAAVLDRHSTAKVAPPLVVVSIGLTSLPRALDLAREHGSSPTRVAPSVYRIPIDEEVTCALSAAVGAAPARLVCGAEWQSVEELLPYATRGLPKENLGGDDLHLELRGAPLQRRYAQEIAAVRLLTGLLLRQGQSDSPRLDRVLTEAAYGVADELKSLATEIDTIELRARLDEGNKALELGGALGFSKDSSFTAQLLEDTAKRAAPPPAVFWDLPRTADTAGYAVGVDPKRIGTLTSVAAELLDAYLEQQKAPPTLRHRLRSVLDGLPLLASPEVNAAGAAASGSKPANALERLNQRLGWRVSVADVRADQLFKLLTDAEGVLADRALPKLVKDRFGVGAERLPKLRHRVVRVAGFPARATAFTLELPAALFDPASDSASTAKGKKPAPAPAAVPCVVLAPDGEKTWISFAQDEKSALARLEAARAGREGKLADVPELQPLKEASNLAGGFSSLEGLLRGLESVLPRRARNTGELFSHAQNHGRTPQLSWISLSQAGTALKLSGTLRMPQGVFQDLGGIIPWLISSGSP
jgi:hypothetical protein